MFGVGVRSTRKALMQKREMKKRRRVKMKKVMRKTLKKKMRRSCWTIQMLENVLLLGTLMPSRKGISHLW